MVTAAHSGKYGVDYTPTELSVVGIYPNAMSWAEALGNHAFKPRFLFKHIQSLNVAHGRSSDWPG
jgi:hypothetical protein